MFVYFTRSNLQLFLKGVRTTIGLLSRTGINLIHSWEAFQILHIKSKNLDSMYFLKEINIAHFSYHFHFDFYIIC